MKKKYVFTYGTLMGDRQNHGQLVRNKYIGDARLKDYSLFDIDGAYFPAITKEDGYYVTGEVYEIDALDEQTLDILEGVGIGLYTKVIEDVEVEGLGIIQAIVYTFTPKNKLYRDMTRCIRCEDLFNYGFNKWTRKTV